MAVPTTRRVLEAAGRTYAQQAAFAVRDKPAALFQLAVLAALLAKPLDADLSDGRRVAPHRGPHPAQHSAHDLAAAGRRVEPRALPAFRRQHGHPRGADWAAGLVDPTAFITQHADTVDAIRAYETFDRCEEGWLKTVLDVAETDIA